MRFYTYPLFQSPYTYVLFCLASCLSVSYLCPIRHSLQSLVLPCQCCLASLSLYLHLSPYLSLSLAPPCVSPYRLRGPRYTFLRNKTQDDPSVVLPPLARCMRVTNGASPSTLDPKPVDSEGRDDSTVGVKG